MRKARMPESLPSQNSSKKRHKTHLLIPNLERFAADAVENRQEPTLKRIFEHFRLISKLFVAERSFARQVSVTSLIANGEASELAELVLSLRSEGAAHSAITMETSLHLL